MNNIFIAFTPYHVLLSYSIAKAKHQNENNYLFIISDFLQTENFVNFFSNFKATPFIKIDIFPGLYKEKSIIKKRIIIKNNINKIKVFLNKYSVDTVYTCHDGRAESQALLYYAKKSNKDSRAVYIEDGSAVYNSHAFENRSIFKFLLGKIFYGRWLQNIRVLGTSSWIDQVIAVFPDLIRPELKRKEIIPLEREDFLKIGEDEVFSGYIESLDGEIDKLQQSDLLLISPHSKFIKEYPKYKEVINEIFRIIKSKKLKIAIKYHPREPLEDFLSVREIKDAVILPKSIPLELLYISNKRLPNFIIGDVSTALLTAKWLLNKHEVISVAPLLNYHDRRFLRLLQKVNIRLINRKEDLENILQV